MVAAVFALAQRYSWSDTIRRVFEALSPMELELRFEAWMGEVCPAVQGRVIAIDGKALRGSVRSGRGLRALHQVSAYAASTD
ncbi:MAG: hypothetical protein IPL70_10505 [Uliginosibacterium sp.]|nr:hypothetical protein [Uliginosibacterium sp.]